MKYTEHMIDTVRSMYSTYTAKEIAQVLSISEFVVYRIAVKFKIKKPTNWINNPKSGGFKKGVRSSPHTEFKKGQTAHNKGKKVSPEIYKQMSKTFFSSGHIPFNHKPMYSISIREDKTGIPYKFIKIGQAHWELLHRYMWMQQHGPIPRNMVVAFRDGNSLNCELSNLMLISRRENMLRNSIANIPEDLKEVVKLKNKLINKLKEHGKKQAK